MSRRTGSGIREHGGKLWSGFRFVRRGNALECNGGWCTRFGTGAKKGSIFGRSMMVAWSWAAPRRGRMRGGALQRKGNAILDISSLV